MAYQIGDLVIVGNHTVTDTGATPNYFHVLDGTATDPTAATLTIAKPDASELVYGWPSAGADGTLTREATGRFYYAVSIDQAGSWYWTLAGTGEVQAVAEGWFYVEPAVT